MLVHLKYHYGDQVMINSKRSEVLSATSFKSSKVALKPLGLPLSVVEAKACLC